VALTLLIPYVGVLAAYQFEARRISAFELNAGARPKSDQAAADCRPCAPGRSDGGALT